MQHVVNNSRFLVLARIKNLASSMLSAVVSRLRADWQTRYGIDPWLIETMVDHKRVWASIEKPPEQVIADMFEEAGARDPCNEKNWISHRLGETLKGKSRLCGRRHAPQRHKTPSRCANPLTNMPAVLCRIRPNQPHRQRKGGHT